MKLAAWIVLLGSLLFQLGAFLPVSRFYVSSVDARMTIMRDHTVQWMIHLGGMGIGALIAAAGLIVLAVRLPAGTSSTLGYVSAALATVGTGLWLWHLQLRIADPVGFASGDNPHWHFMVYTAMMQVALLLLAAAFRSASLPSWMVLVLVGGTLLTLLALLIFHDVPPFAHYVWLLAIGIGLVLSAGE